MITQLTPTSPKRDKPGYAGREQTLAADRQQIGEIVNRTASTFEKAIDPRRKQVNLADMEAVNHATAAYLRECSRRAELPTVMALAAALGHHRTGLYRYGDRHPDFKEFLEDFSALCGEALEAAALTGATKETMSIFILKAKFGYKDTVTLEAVQPPALGTVDMETAEIIAAKYAELPED